jgi:AAA domain
VAHSSSASYALPGDVNKVRGKSAGLDVGHNLEGKNITSITTVGRDAPTLAERDRGDAILAMLQGILPLFENHWMKAIWMPSESVIWPENFAPPPDAPAIEVVQHSKAPLNPSQHLAVTKMLSPSLDNNITLIQGPPGTGKTTVIANYVISAIQAGKRGIWLMAQSNVAVKNIAEKLAKLDFFNFKLLVSHNFHFEW